MILRTVTSGVSEERIARSINVDVASIRQQLVLLDGICPEVVGLLREWSATGAALRELRKVRQVEIAEFMSAADIFSVGYAKCLVATTPVEHLLEGERGNEVRGSPRARWPG